ncbi:Exopolysaccharide synthesis protein [Candidatus Magnetobacterium bavaricum]|uniref:Exopolysaccharide synthesis protein n=1 Tax=Candidatus Magnetobacterium bavaricum TaxID=29290 RepID=A0A0F3GZY2_9BACT|nr:Exopolysaccharide synthesis protein [Candidatus Magnetobacterium bavaricum]
MKQMPDDSYRIVFKGDILAGYDKNRVADALTRVFNAGQKKAEMLFGGKPVIIKKDVSYEVAKKYKASMNKAGADCLIISNKNGKNSVSDTPLGNHDAAGSIKKTDKHVVLPNGHVALTTTEASCSVKEITGDADDVHEAVNAMSNTEDVNLCLNAETACLTATDNSQLDNKPNEQPRSDDVKEQVVTIPCKLNIQSNLEVPDELISREVVNGNSTCLSGSAIYYKQREEMVNRLTVGQGITGEDRNRVNTEKQPPITEIRSHAIQQKSSNQGTADVIGQSDGLQGKNNAATVSKGTVSDDEWEETDHRPNMKQSSATSVGKATGTKVCLVEKTLSLIKKNGREQSIFDGHLTCASREQGYRKILVTSANNLEGKTITAISIAYTISKSSYDSVLLVDGNIHKPAIHKLFDTVNTPGLTDYLLERQQYDDSIQMTAYGNLSIMSSGSEISNPNRLYDVAIFDERINRLKDDFKYIIYDGHSVLTYPDTSIIASYFDAIVMVVECEKTKYDVLTQAKDKLEAVGGKVWGVVMNKRKFYIPRFLYGKI